MRVFITFCLILSLGRVFVFSQNAFGDVFLQGDYVELGISSCGSFGSRSSAPSNFHPRPSASTTTGQLGFVANPQKNNWSSYNGDYFVPGSPVEGWGVQVGNNVYLNGNQSNMCFENDISGGFTTTIETGNTRSATWQTDQLIDNSISVCQTVAFGIEDLFFTVEVTLKNESDQVLPEVFYLRSVDPDNDVTLSGGSYATVNTVVSQGDDPSNIALVSATGTQFNDIYLGLGALNSNARVGIRSDNIILPNTIREVWDRNGVYSENSSSSDVNIALAFKFENVQPDETVKFTYAYILDASDINRAIQSTNEFSFLVNNQLVQNNGTVTISSGDLANISIQGPTYQWSWTPSTGLNQTTGSNVIASPSETTTYTVTGASGCESEVLNLTIEVESSCSPQCIPSFSPKRGEKYMLNAWVKESDETVETYANAGVKISFAGPNTETIYYASGQIIDGWQLIEAEVEVPDNATAITVTLVNSGTNDAFFDDIRLHPFNGNMKSFVYDPIKLRLMAEMDERNYATFYEYDEEGALTRVKKETVRGVKTIQESRNNSSRQ